jgi:hypothetical protein
MGLNLLRESFSEWLEGYGPESRAQYLAMLEEHVGQKIDVSSWQLQDADFPRVGSYTTYGIFRLCLHFITRGDYARDLEADEDVEREALKDFRAKLKPAASNVPYAAHFLDSGDTDTIFIPILFTEPFAYDDRFVASLPGGVRALEAFADALSFDLAMESEREYDVENGQWLPVPTAKNVARLLYGFFTEKPNACVALS